MREETKQQELVLQELEPPAHAIYLYVMDLPEFSLIDHFHLTNCCCEHPSSYLGRSDDIHILMAAQAAWLPNVAWLDIQHLPKPSSKPECASQKENSYL